MDEIIIRIKNQREKLGYSFQDLAKLTGLSRSTLQRYESGAIKNIPLSKVNILAEALEVSPAYIMGWEDEFKNKEYGKDLRTVQKVKAPIIKDFVDSVAVYAAEEVGYYDNQGKIDFAFIINDDSMINAKLEKGDVVYARNQSKVKDKEIALILVDKKIVLRRFKNFQDIIILQAENPDYDDILIKEKDFNNIKIIGKAIFKQSFIK